MKGRDAGRRPPKIAEWLLTLVVGRDPQGRSIVGDAREEFDTRGRESWLGPTVWYWTHVFRFVVGYGRGGGPRGCRADGTGNRWASWVSALMWDLRSSARSLMRRPGLAGTVVVTLSVGLGTTTLAFALVDGVLLRPLPFPDPGSLVDVSRVDPEWYGPNPSPAQAGNVFATPPATLFDWERSASSFSSLGAYAWTASTFAGDVAPERIEGAVATAGLFEALGVAPMIGRPLTAADLAPGAAPVIVLGHGLWVSRFGSDPAVLGQPISLDGVPTTVIGVMPADFSFPDETTRFWRPLYDEDRTDPTRNAGFLHALGRLAPGVSLAQARAEIAAIQERLGETHADEARFIAVAFSRLDLMVAAARPGLLLLLGAAAIVLLVGCANVANLLLTRVTERRRELALHAALGARRRRLAGLLLGESLLLAGLGGIGGVVLVRLVLEPFVSAFPMALPRAAGIQLDMRILVASLGATVATGLLLGVLPVIRSGRMDLNGVLRDGGHGAAGGRRSARAQGLLVVSEIALSVLLLGTAGIFVESYLNSARQERGFSTEGVLVFRLALPESRAETPHDVRSFYRDLLPRLSAIPGVQSVALAQQMPYGGCCSSPPASIDTRDGVQAASIHTASVTPDYFATMDIPILRGRGLLESDRAGDRRVVVVSEAMARRFWPDEDAVGQRVRRESGESAEWAEVVGVAGNVRYSFGGSEFVEYYRAFEQSSYASQSVSLKTLVGATGIAEAAEGIVHSIDPTIPVAVRSMSNLARSDRRYRSARVGSLILMVLAGVATALAVLGVYSVLAYGVAQRTREIGIRVSLGGTRARVLHAVLRRGLIMSAMGIGVGLGLSVGSAAILRAGLVDVGTVNPRVLLAVAFTMLITSVLASIVPAWKAVRVDPLVAFRQE